MLSLLHRSVFLVLSSLVSYMDRLTAAVLELANDSQGCIKRAKKAQDYVNSLNQKCIGKLEENF